MLHSAEQIIDYWLTSPNPHFDDELDEMNDPASMHDGPSIQEMEQDISNGSPFHSSVFFKRQRATRY